MVGKRWASFGWACVVVVGGLACGGAEAPSEQSAPGEVKAPVEVVAEQAQPPSGVTAVARLDGTPSSGPAPLLARFDGTQSTPSRPRGGSISCRWDFGDGSPAAEGCRVEHVYQAVGTFTATLTATDATGASGQATLQLSAKGTGGATRFAQLFARSTGATVAGHPEGDAFVAVNDETGSTLMRQSPEGLLRWTIRQQGQRYDFAGVSSQRAHFFSVSLEYPEQTNSEFAPVLSGDDWWGDGLWCGEPGSCAPGPYATLASEEVQAKIFKNIFTWQLWIGLDQSWGPALPENLPMRYDQVAVAPDGSVFAAARVLEAFDHAGRPFPAGLMLLKFDRSRQLLWTQPLGGAGRWTGLGTSAQGTLVAAVQAEEALGSAVTEAGAWLLTLESDGALRWAQRLPGRDFQLGVDGVGEAVVAGASQELDCEGGARVLRLNLKGEQLWTRSFCGGELQVQGLAIAGHDAVLVGRQRGTVAWGEGHTTKAPLDSAFLLRLGR